MNQICWNINFLFRKNPALSGNQRGEHKNEGRDKKPYSAGCNATERNRTNSQTQINDDT